MADIPPDRAPTGLSLGWQTGLTCSLAAGLQVLAVAGMAFLEISWGTLLAFPLVVAAQWLGVLGLGRWIGTQRKLEGLGAARAILGFSTGLLACVGTAHLLGNGRDWLLGVVLALALAAYGWLTGALVFHWTHRLQAKPHLALPVAVFGALVVVASSTLLWSLAFGVRVNWVGLDV